MVVKSKFRSLPQEQILWILLKGDKLPLGLLSMIHDWGNMSDQKVAHIVWIKDPIIPVSKVNKKPNFLDKIALWLYNKSLIKDNKK